MSKMKEIINYIDHDMRFRIFVDNSPSPMNFSNKTELLEISLGEYKIQNSILDKVNKILTIYVKSPQKQAYRICLECDEVFKFGGLDGRCPHCNSLVTTRIRHIETIDDLFIEGFEV